MKNGVSIIIYFCKTDKARPMLARRIVTQEKTVIDDVLIVSFKEL